MFRCRAVVHQPMYEHNGKQYLRLRLPPDAIRIVRNIEERNAYKFGKGCFVYEDFFNDTLIIKVPFRYHRVMCPVTGAKPVQELFAGDDVDVEVDYTGTWSMGNHTGHSWKIKNIHTY